MSPFSPPTATPPRDLAALLRVIEAGLLCGPRQAREIASAIRSLGAWLHTGLDRLPTDPAALRRHLAKLHSERVGVSPARFANVKSLLNRALALAGVKPANRPIAEALSPSWARLFLKLREEPYIRSSLSPFARFCSALAIEPNAISDKITAHYLEHLEQYSLRRPATTHQTVCRAWEQARSRIAGWPEIAVTVPFYGATYTRPLTAFPASFQADLDSYLGRLGCEDVSDLLDPAAPVRPLKQSSIKT
ncbi:MAG: hypothetical protein ABI224_14040 [Acetobacteraceae bacterium]